MSSERRQNPRIALSIDVDLESGTNFYTGLTRDISAGGVFIETEMAIPVGEELSLRLCILEKNFTLRSQVMWSMASADGKILGVGCRFVRLQAAQRKAIEDFMAQRGPMDFEVEAEEEEFERAPERPGRKPRKK